jgi:hypothetical protein
MLRELQAYHDPWTKGIVNITEKAGLQNVDDGRGGDSTDDYDVDDIGPVIELSIPPITATLCNWLRDAARGWRWTDVSLRVTIQEIAFERLIDLRTPTTAKWFAHNLSLLRWITGDGSEMPAFPRKEPLNHFIHLLPSLITQIHGGGNGATRIAGQWLRAIGADALVFPSARSDSQVTVENGELVSFGGWNLVDYREAEPVRIQTFDLTPDWPANVATEVDKPPLTSYADVLIQKAASQSGDASWSWKGVELANSAIRSFSSALHIYAWARTEVASEQLQLVSAILGASDRPEAMRATSDRFVQAMLGDGNARVAMLESLTELNSHDAAIFDLEETFRRMDRRIDDGKAGKL